MAKIWLYQCKWRVTASASAYPLCLLFQVSFKGKDLLEMEAEERSHNGVFLSFQAPIEIPGVSNLDFLRSSYNAQREARGEAEMDPLEFFGYVTPKLENLKMDPSFLDRNVNEGLSQAPQTTPF